MSTWEYLEVRPPILGTGQIRGPYSSLNKLANALQITFPEAKVKVKGKAIAHNIPACELMNFLGTERWELVCGYEVNGWVTLAFKRPM